MRNSSFRSIQVRLLISCVVFLVPLFLCVFACKNPKAASPETTLPKGLHISSYRPNVSLTGTYWKLIELNGKPILLGAGKKELHMVFNTEDRRVAGFSGCNRFTGGYKVKENQIEFSHIASTRMACVDSMEQEQHFMFALENTKQFKINGKKLFMQDTDGKILFCCEAIHLK
jgi:heat shock protein HslJ